MQRLAGQITHENNPELYAVMDQLNLAVAIFTADGLLLYVNEYARQLLNCSREQVNIANIWGLPVWKDEQQARRYFYSLIKKIKRGRSHFFELTLPHETRACSLYIEMAPIFAPDGTLERVVAQAQDVTAYRQVQDQLKRQRHLLSTTLNSAPVILFVVDSDGVVQLSRGRARTLLEARGLQPVGRHLTETYGDHPDVLNNYLRALRGEQFNVRVPIFDLVFDVHYAPLREDNGEIAGVVGVGIDITQQAQVEVELAELQHRISQAAETERLRLAQDLHDGPLQAMITITYQLQSLEQGLENASDMATFRDIQGALQSTIRELRALCGELRPPTLAPFGLEKAIRSSAEQFQKKHPQTLLLLEMDADRQLLPEMTRLTLFRIFQEALNNIARHADATLVKVKLLLSDDEVSLEIADNGNGFELPTRWLAMARRGHLGLVGAMERAQALGGNLQVKSTPGEGVTLYVSVPRQLQQPCPEE